MEPPFPEMGKIVSKAGSQGQGLTRDVSGVLSLRCVLNILVKTWKR